MNELGDPHPGREDKCKLVFLVPCLPPLPAPLFRTNPTQMLSYRSVCYSGLTNRCTMYLTFSQFLLELCGLFPSFSSQVLPSSSGGEAIKIQMLFVKHFAHGPENMRSCFYYKHH